MTRILFVSTLLCWSLYSFAQEQDPVHWQCKATKVKDKVYELHFTAYIDMPWHIYSQTTSAENAQPTEIQFSHSPLIDMDGKPVEKGDLQKESVAGVTIYYYESQVDFVQTVHLKAAVKTNATGTIQYMACTEGRCLPPAEHHFALALQ